MKKLLSLCFLLIFTFSFSGEKRISEIKTLEFITKEKIILNNEKRETVYNVKFKIPEKIKKEIITPEINRGELYIYNGREKIVYLPIFEQITYEQTTSDENRIIEVINYILQKEKEDITFKKKYYSGEVRDIVLEDGIKIKFKVFEKIEGYMLPKEFEIYDKNIKIGDIFIESYKINPTFNEKEFILEK